MPHPGSAIDMCNELFGIFNELFDMFNKLFGIFNKSIDIFNDFSVLFCGLDVSHRCLATRNFQTLVRRNYLMYSLAFCIAITLDPHHLVHQVS